MSSYTDFRRTVFAGNQPVILGTAADTVATDMDAVVARLFSDTIFANGFE